METKNVVILLSLFVILTIVRIITHRRRSKLLAFYAQADVNPFCETIINKVVWYDLFLYQVDLRQYFQRIVEQNSCVNLENVLDSLGRVRNAKKQTFCLKNFDEVIAETDVSLLAAVCSKAIKSSYGNDDLVIKYKLLAVIKTFNLEAKKRFLQELSDDLYEVAIGNFEMMTHIAMSLAEIKDELKINEK